jgi:hypothetical protein
VAADVRTMSSRRLVSSERAKSAAAKHHPPSLNRVSAIMRESVISRNRPVVLGALGPKRPVLGRRQRDIAGIRVFQADSRSLNTRGELRCSRRALGVCVPSRRCSRAPMGDKRPHPRRARFVRATSAKYLDYA